VVNAGVGLVGREEELGVKEEVVTGMMVGEGMGGMTQVHFVPQVVPTK
jgi:hypothetical protein